MGRAAALATADDPVPLRRWAGVAGQGSAPPVHADASPRAFYRPQDEYCEWRVERDAAGRIVRVTFTSEPPEYWQALHGDDLPAETPDQPSSSFPGDPQVLLELYREHVDPSVQLADLRRDGRYDPYNRWNTVDGIMHLTHPSNTLRAEITLGADATVLRARERRLTGDPDALIVGAGYGGNDRCSDPTIGASVNHLAALGYAVTLQDPVGLYMDHLDMTGWTLPNDEPIDPDWFRIVRGTPGFVARAVFEVPAGEGLTVSDLRIGGEPIRTGGQLAEHMTIKIVGLAAVGAGFRNRPAGSAVSRVRRRGEPVGRVLGPRRRGVSVRIDPDLRLPRGHHLGARGRAAGAPAQRSASAPLDACVMTADTTRTAPLEPVLDVHDIQGNALPGFMKPNMVLVALAIEDVDRARRWLGAIAPQVTTLEGVMASRRLVRAARTLRPKGARVGAVPAAVDDVWLNIAISYAGLQRLADGRTRLAADLDQFEDQAFRLGPGRSVVAPRRPDRSRMRKATGPTGSSADRNARPTSCASWPATRPTTSRKGSMRCVPMPSPAA